MKVSFGIKRFFVVNVALVIGGIAMGNDPILVAGIINLSTLSVGIHILEAIHDK